MFLVLFDLVLLVSYNWRISPRAHVGVNSPGYITGPQPSYKRVIPLRGLAFLDFSTCGEFDFHRFVQYSLPAFSFGFERRLLGSIAGTLCELLLLWFDLHLSVFERYRKIVSSTTIGLLTV